MCFCSKAPYAYKGAWHLFSAETDFLRLLRKQKVRQHFRIGSHLFITIITCAVLHRVRGSEPQEGEGKLVPELHVVKADKLFHEMMITLVA